MLVLSRKRNEAIVIDGDIRIMVVAVHGNQVRLGVDAPDSVKIVRKELRDRARREGAACEGIAAGLLSGHARD